MPTRIKHSIFFIESCDKEKEFSDELEVYVQDGDIIIQNEHLDATALSVQIDIKDWPTIRNFIDSQISEQTKDDKK